MHCLIYSNNNLGLNVMEFVLLLIDAVTYIVPQGSTDIFQKSLSLIIIVLCGAGSVVISII